MKIAIMAAGAVGGYFGARLADAGHEVTFIARGKHLDAIRKDGLRIKSDLGDLHLKDISATDDPRAVGPVDVIIFAVKLWDTISSIEACKPMLSKDTAVISLLNGVSASAQISESLGPQHNLPGSAYISSVISEPGVILHIGNFSRMTFGEIDNKPSHRSSTFLKACLECGIEASIPEDVEVSLWTKFVALATLSGMTTASRSSIGKILSDPDMKKTYIEAMSEIVAVGRARGVNLAEDIVDTRMAFVATLPPEMTASSLKDLENGNRTETPWLTGAVVQMARELSIPVPINETLNAILKPFENGCK